MREKKVLPHVEDRTLTVRPPRVANVAPVLLHRPFSTFTENARTNTETVYCFLILHHHFSTLVGEPKFHSWGRCTIALTNMHSDLRFNSSSCLCINLHYIIYVGSLFRILGCNY